MKSGKITKITAVTLIVTVFIACGFMTVIDEAAATTNTNNTQVTIKASKNTTTKTATMKIAAKKTYKTTKKTIKAYKPKTVINTATKKRVAQKTVKTITKTNYTKGSKKKRIKTNTTTITKTTTVTKKATTTAATTTATTISDLKAAVTPNLIQAFNTLGFKIKINKTASYAGVFSPTKHYIGLRTYNVNTFLHEMGHFLACLKNKADQTTAFKAIYKKEKSAYNGTNRTYILANSREYFAESYKEYVKEPKTLKSKRPATYAYINKAVKSIDQADITRTKNQYDWAW